MFRTYNSKLIKFNCLLARARACKRMLFLFSAINLIKGQAVGSDREILHLSDYYNETFENMLQVHAICKYLSWTRQTAYIITESGLLLMVRHFIIQLQAFIIITNMLEILIQSLTISAEQLLGPLHRWYCLNFKKRVQENFLVGE